MVRSSASPLDHSLELNYSGSEIIFLSLKRFQSFSLIFFCEVLFRLRLNPCVSSGMCTKEMTDGKRSQKKQQTIRELTWPRMRKNFVNPVKGSELTKATPPAERQDSGSSVTGKFKDSPKSIRLPFGGSGGKKRSSILGFKFSPAASVKSRNSSKCSTSSYVVLCAMLI